MTNVSTSGGVKTHTGPHIPADGSLDQKNVVLILLDDGGAERFNWSGLAAPASGHALTPRLDQLRTQGVTFLNAYACPICGPSRGAIESGRHSFREGQGFGTNIEDVDEYAFGLDSRGSPTIMGLARALRIGSNNTDDLSIGLGNFTHAIGWFGKCHLCSPIGFEDYAINQKYGRYKGCQPNVPAFVDDGIHPSDTNGGHFHFVEVTSSFGTPPILSTWGSGAAWTLGHPDFVAWSPSPPRKGWDAYINVRDAINWINSRTQPFLLKLCLNPPHAPFEVPPYTIPDDVGFNASNGTVPLISPATQGVMSSLDNSNTGPGYRTSNRSTRVKIFNANLEAFDTLIGLLCDRIDPAILGATIFILMGDNGTVTDAVEPPYDPAHAKRTIYEQGSRVPLIVWNAGPHIASPGRTSTHLVHAVDVFSTILDLCRAEPSRWNPGGSITIDGKSFERVLAVPNTTAPRTFIYNEIFTPLDAWAGGGAGHTIAPASWHSSYSDGVYKVIKRPQGANPPYEFYKITGENQPASRQPGYFELAVDNLYPIVVANTDPTLTAKFNELENARVALIV